LFIVTAQVHKYQQHSLSHSKLAKMAIHPSIHIHNSHVRRSQDCRCHGDHGPEPDPDENRTDLENRERRDDTESQDRMPTRKDIEMESEAESMNPDNTVLSVWSQR